MLELTYFPVYAKGLQLACILEASGLAWTGVTTTKDGLAVLKEKGDTPFGQLPILKCGEGLVVGQSVAIANYVGRLGKTDGASDADFARSQMCLAEGEDLYALLISHELARWKPADIRNAKRAAQETLFSETAPKHLALLEGLIQGEAFTSTGQSTGELYLFGMLLQLTGACNESTMLAPFPKLQAWFNKTSQLPAVLKVLSGASAIGKLGPYFLNDKDYAAFNQ
ncbi:hypothetical protein M885DRAFT_531050 [Pelagophyceae sp. CCMP2097]|nr:hypothetical protein M885DRAFT_551778 [Pelagophyceae sp. CCMP2097]KAJ1450982.1 hypothetical protein M885DRAFT_531050 [Pelagophyceae sp. CCMP2097]